MFNWETCTHTLIKSTAVKFLVNTLKQKVYEPQIGSPSMGDFLMAIFVYNYYLKDLEKLIIGHC